KKFLEREQSLPDHLLILFQSHANILQSFRFLSHHAIRKFQVVFLQLPVQSAQVLLVVLLSVFLGLEHLLMTDLMVLDTLLHSFPFQFLSQALFLIRQKMNLSHLKSFSPTLFPMHALITKQSFLLVVLHLERWLFQSLAMYGYLQSESYALFSFSLVVQWSSQSLQFHHARIFSTDLINQHHGLHPTESEHVHSQIVEKPHL